MISYTFNTRKDEGWPATDWLLVSTFYAAPDHEPIQQAAAAANVNNVNILVNYLVNKIIWYSSFCL